MDSRAIGVFDSGLGGLTAAKVLLELLPREDIVFFGDSLRNPYGSRTKEDLCAISAQNTRFLEGFGVKAILMACGSTSSVALDTLREQFRTPFFGVVDAACQTAAKTTKNGKIGVIATPAAIGSGAYGRKLAELDPALTVFPLACPGLAHMVEQGHFRPGDPVAEKAVPEELRALSGTGIDTLLLGCTHYPLLSDLIAAFLGPEVVQISAGAEAARSLAAYLRENGLLSPSSDEGKRLWFTSGDPEAFSQNAGIFLGREIKAKQHIITECSYALIHSDFSENNTFLGCGEEI